MAPLLLRKSLLRFAEQHMFLSSLRFVTDVAQFSFWDEAVSMNAAVQQALTVWTDHRTSAALPDWEVVSLEVFDKAAYYAHRNQQSVLAGAEEIRVPL